MKAVRMIGVTQRFGAITALDNVDLEVERGDIHAIVGENGAGKTTLMRVLYGALRPDEGRLEIDERPAAFESSRQAIAAGIGMVSQHYGIIPALSCLQNLILGAEGGLLIDERAAERRAEELANKMGFEFAWRKSASTLSPAATQKLEILKLLWRNSRIMILDEPTAMLSPADGDALFASMRRLAAEGATVILVTHRLPEVMDHCARVTVLRGGRRVAEMPVSETSPPELARLIIGSDSAVPKGGLGLKSGIDVHAPRRHEPSVGYRANDGNGNPEGVAANSEGLAAKRPTLEPGPQNDPTPKGFLQRTGLNVENLVVRGDQGDDKLKDVSFQARRGEIVGIAGVDGSGQRELFHALVGFRGVRAGEITFDGQDMTRTSAADRIRAGLRVIAEDRHSEGVIESWSLEQNAALGLQRLPPLASGALVDPKAKHTWAEKVAAKFKTRHGGLNLPMASLSGGNQQRFVAARALEMDPQMLLAFQPARGLDLGGTANVYAAIRERVDGDAAAVVVSFDLDELLEHCDRIVVMNRGRLVQPAAGEEKDRRAIGELMVSAA